MIFSPPPIQSISRDQTKRFVKYRKATDEQQILLENETWGTGDKIHVDFFGFPLESSDGLKEKGHL